MLITETPGNASPVNSPRNSRRLATHRSSLMSHLFFFRRLTALFHVVCGTLVLGFLGSIASVRAESATEKNAWAAFQGDSAPAETARYVSGGAENQSLEIYLPPGNANSAAKKPVLIFVHGGGWSGGDRTLLAPHARYFAARGWVSVNISYRLISEPGVTLQKAADDVRAAYDWVKNAAAQRSWDAGRISAFGESAGGQLACALGVLPPDPQRWRAHSLVLVNPVLDLTTLPWSLGAPGVREGGPITPANIAQHPARAVSPLFHLTADSPPILVLHGRKDTSVPVTQAEAFAAAGKKNGAHVELFVFENMAHAFLLKQYGNPETMRAALKRAADFLGEP
jgi:acetyl esterase/lipase